MPAAVPPDAMETTTPAQERALAHETRLLILRSLPPDGATVSQLANRLLINKGNIAHHMRVLLAAGLVRRGRDNTVRGGTEQYYVAAAERLRFGAGENGAVTRAMLRAVAEEIPTTGAHLLQHRVLRLTAAQATALARHLESFVDRLPPAGRAEREYAVLVAVYPRPR